MQALLPVAGQRIAPTDLADPERISKDVMDSREHARVRVDAFEDRIAIHEIVDVPGAALLNYRGAAILLTPALERRSQARQPVRIDDLGKHNVSVTIERNPLVRRQRRLCDAELG